MLNVGIGLTSKCNCACKHCYSRIYGNNTFLNTDLLMRFLEKFQIGSVNFGTGESYFHPDFLSIVDYLNKNKVKISVTSNGYTVSKLDDVYLAKFHDIDFSLDYPNAKMHDASRAVGCYQMVMDGIKRCKSLGIMCSIAWCLTTDNSTYIEDMFNLCHSLGIFLRINIYKPVEGKRGFGYKEFWNAVNSILLYGDVVSISEGIVNAAINNKNRCTGCNSHNLRIFPDGTMSSCVYVPNRNMVLKKACMMTEKELLQQFQVQYDIPNDQLCIQCEKFELCKSGCMARRRINERLRDEFCFVDKEEKPEFSRIVFSKSKSEMFVHSNYICTMIMEPREVTII